MARGRTVRTPRRARVFVETLRATGGNVSRACDAVSIGRQTAYDWRGEDEDFAAAWDEAVEAGLDDLEQEARRRAFEGLTQKKFTKGGQPIIDPVTQEQYFERVYSDTILLRLLSAGRPKFRERSDSFNLNMTAEELANLPDEDLDKLIAKFERKR
jgi:hypothetical protein